MRETPAAGPPPGGEALVAEAPVIPWERRRQIGRIAAYWKTVFLVLRRNGRLGAHLAGRVNYRDAQKFRWLTIAHALALPVAGAPTIPLPGTIPENANLRAFFLCDHRCQHLGSVHGGLADLDSLVVGDQQYLV